MCHEFQNYSHWPVKYNYDWRSCSMDMNSFHVYRALFLPYVALKTFKTYINKSQIDCQNSFLADKCCYMELDPILHCLIACMTK